MKTWLDKLNPIYEGLPYMEIEGESISYPCVAEIKLDGEFQYLIKKDGKTYLADKQVYGRIRTDMPVTNVDIPDNSVFLAELVWNAGKSFYEFARHKLDADCNLGIFSCVRYKGEDLWGKVPYTEVRDLLEKQTFYNNKVVLIPAIQVADSQELKDLFDRLVANGYEGLVAKQPNSKYVNGKTLLWTKRKFEDEADLVIVGYQTGTKRAKNLSVLLGHLVNGQVKQLTHCGGGFNLAEKATLLKVLQGCKVVGKQKDDILVEPQIVVKIIHNGIIRNPDGSANSLRHPRFDRFRFDKTVAEIDTIK